MVLLRNSRSFHDVLAGLAPVLAALLPALGLAAFAATAVVPGAIRLGLCISQFKIDFAFVQVNTRHRDADRVTKAIHLVCAFADQAMVYGVKVIVVMFQGRDMDQALDIELL